MKTTGYSRSAAETYDSRRFTGEHGKLFNRLETERILEVLNLFKAEQKILEVGCGTGRFLIECAKRGHTVHGLDLSAYMLEECKVKANEYDNIILHLGESGALPFNEGSFDFVYSIRTLNQLSSKEYAIATINEIIRVCKSGGTILVEYINKNSLSIRNKKSVKLTYNELCNTISGKAHIQEISGILFLTETIMRKMPLKLLPVFEKVDRLLCKHFPRAATRCYMLICKE